MLGNLQKVEDPCIKKSEETTRAGVCVCVCVLHSACLSQLSEVGSGLCYCLVVLCPSHININRQIH